MGFSKTVFAKIREVLGVDALSEQMQQQEKLLHNLIEVVKNGQNGINGHIHGVKQIANLIARRKSGVRNPKIVCLFLVQVADVWDGFSDIYTLMKGDKRFHPIAISMARAFAEDHKFYGENLIHEFLDSIGIPHLRFSVDDSYQGLDVLKSIDSDYIFIQSPWDETFPHGYRMPEITFSKVCYIPYYGILLIDKYMENEKVDLGTNLYTHRNCYRIFCESEWHKQQYRQTCLRGDDHVVVTGHPKLDTLYGYRKANPYWPIRNPSPGASVPRPFRLIWAPHHSVGNVVLRFGVFLRVYREMLAWASSSVDVEFVLKPHPLLLLGLVKQGHMAEEALKEWLDQWNALPNTALFEGGGYGGLFAGSDAMLTDGISFLVEYPLATGKPIIFMDSGNHASFNQFGQLAEEYSCRVMSVDGAKRLVADFRAGRYIDKSEVERKLIERCLPFPGKSAEKVIQSLVEDFQATYQAMSA